MAEQNEGDHPSVPGLAAMAWFAVFLGIGMISLVLALHFKFGTPG